MLESGAPTRDSIMQRFAEKCDELQELIESRNELPSLSEILFMLSLKGKPYTLQNHFLMEPFFSLEMPPRMVGKCCRQCGKTNNAAGAELLISNVIPHHSTLIITPRFEQVKRISSQYIRPLVNDSPINSLFVNQTCEQSVLQRSFTSRSVMYFSFAFLDAERIRGIPADRLWVDECELKFSAVQTTAGERFIGYNLEKNDEIFAFDENDNIVVDRVVNVVCKGMRPTWKITLVDGRTLTCTSNARLKTDKGWVYLQKILDHGLKKTFIPRDRKESRQPSNTFSKRSGIRDLIGGQLDELGEAAGPPARSFTCESQQQTRGLLQTQSTNSEELCEPCSSNRREQRLGKEKLCFQHRAFHGIRLLVGSVLPNRRQDKTLQENPDQRVGETTDSSKSRKYVIQAENPSEKLFTHSPVPILRQKNSSQNPLWKFPQYDLLRKLSTKTTSNLKQTLPGQQSRADKYSSARSIPQESGASSKIQSGKKSSLLSRSEEAQGTKRIQKEVASETEIVEARGDGIVQLLRGPYPAKQPQKRCTDDRLLKTWMQSGKKQAESIRLSPAKENEKLVPIAIESIEYAGKAEVWDVETEKNHTLLVNGIAVHNCQDMNWDFIPLIEQTLAGSESGGCMRFTGTPKGMANTKQKLWEMSSQAEWLIKCPHCNHWNIPALEHHLLKMIGKHTIVCGANCGKPIDPRTGLYVHRYSDLRKDFPGYHISQPITPLYYDNHEYPDHPTQRWRELLHHMNSYPTAKFMNECLGESYDDEERLITQRDIRNISITDRKNELREAIKASRNYNRTAVGIDWGGGGDATKSYTVLTYGGLQPGRQGVDVLYAIRFNAKLGPLEILRAVIEHIKLLKPTFIAHDYTGAGYNWQAALQREGIPAEKIMPFSYCSSEHRNVIYYRRASSGTRAAYQIDKPRSINVLTLMIKAKQITFPEFEGFRHLSEDLLNIFTERTERPRGSDIWLISKAAAKSDDFVHALNFLCSGLWWMIQKYPSLEEAFSMRYTIEDLEKMGGHRNELTLQDWESENEPEGDQ